MQPPPKTVAALAALAVATDDTGDALVEELDQAAATTRSASARGTPSRRPVPGPSVGQVADIVLDTRLL